MSLKYNFVTKRSFVQNLRWKLSQNIYKIFLRSSPFFDFLCYHGLHLLQLRYKQRSKMFLAWAIVIGSLQPNLLHVSL